MITFLRGELASVSDSMAVLDVNGVGFRISVSTRDAANLPGAGSEVRIFTHMSVSEDAIRLYGFLSEDDLNVFRTLISISGVGPKAALGILGVMDADALRIAVFSDDEKAVSRAPGIGAKTAKRLILELKDKLRLEDVAGIAQAQDAAGAESLSGSQDMRSEINDAVAALTSLGYSYAESLRAVRRVKTEDGMQTQDILKAALRYVGL